MVRDLVDLRLFVAVAETQSMTRGAKRAHLSLPAASVRIKNLEASVGTKLFYRASRGVALTSAGDALLGRARVVLQQLDSLSSDLQGDAPGAPAHVRISAVTSAITDFLPETLGPFLTSHPNLTVHLFEDSSPRVVRAVLERSTDLGIVAGGIRDQGLEMLPYRHYRLVAVVPLSHPLAGAKRIGFAELLGCDFIGLDDASTLQRFLAYQAGRHHRDLRVRIRVSNFDALCRLVEAGVGVGVLPAPAARRYQAITRVALVEIAERWFTRELKLCVRKGEDLPAIVRSLLDHLSAAGQAMSQH